MLERLVKVRAAETEEGKPSIDDARRFDSAFRHDTISAEEVLGLLRRWDIE